ncbi:MAG: response regulator, partial [Spirochaetes bacterium]|nr:response regulator [Spirochaetota bacterium]
FTILFHKYTLLKNDVVQKGINYSTPIINISTKQLFPEEHKEGRKNILAVEDNIDLLAFLQENLNEQYNFYYAINGKEALEKLKEMPEKPHLILLDLMMDVMSGDDFLIKMRKEEEYKNVSVIILTARTEKSESLKQLGQGAIDYIQKPFDIDILAVKIDAIIKSQEVQKITVMLENKEAVKKIYEEYKITKRQLEIIRLLNEGLEYRQVALKLNISENSVKTLIKRIYKKCKVINKIELFKVLKMVF